MMQWSSWRKWSPSQTPIESSPPGGLNSGSIPLGELSNPPCVFTLQKERTMSRTFTVVCGYANLIRDERGIAYHNPFQYLSLPEGKYQEFRSYYTRDPRMIDALGYDMEQLDDAGEQYYSVENQGIVSIAIKIA